MADTAFKIQYRDEFIPAFEKKLSLFAATTVNEAVINGNQCTFLVAGTGGAEAVTRGNNGLIPGRSDDLEQLTATLKEWHDKPKRTKFNIFGSQGDGRRIMQEGTIKVLNRRRDKDIITALDTGTVDTGTAVTASLAWVARIRAILGLAEVDVDEEDNMFAAITPAAEAYLLQVKEYGSADYVDVKPLTGPSRKMKRWMGFNWFVSSRNTGVGTATENCYFYHRNAIGSAVNTGEMDVAAGYNDEESYYWARASAFTGAKLLQNSGLVIGKHDGSAYVGQ